MAGVKEGISNILRHDRYVKFTDRFNKNIFKQWHFCPFPRESAGEKMKIIPRF
ncbi:MAG: hypothetical protein LBR79_01770 [Oscillospiraceae bacterium]|jgi:hypothetical protein|nr:hypothetical protein [Oscillospiraceae bacterium]